MNKSTEVISDDVCLSYSSNCQDHCSPTVRTVHSERDHSPLDKAVQVIVSSHQQESDKQLAIDTVCSDLDKALFEIDSTISDLTMSEEKSTAESAPDKSMVETSEDHTGSIGGHSVSVQSNDHLLEQTKSNNLHTEPIFSNHQDELLCQTDALKSHTDPVNPINDTVDSPADSFTHNTDSTDPNSVASVINTDTNQQPSVTNQQPSVLNYSSHAELRTMSQGVEKYAESAIKEPIPTESDIIHTPSTQPTPINQSETTPKESPHKSTNAPMACDTEQEKAQESSDTVQPEEIPSWEEQTPPGMNVLFCCFSKVCGH